MATKLTPEQLADESRYRLILKLSYNDIPGFVLRYLSRKNRITFFFWLSSLFFLLLAIHPTIEFFSVHPGIQIIALYGFYGLVAFPILLIPVHEGIHALFFLLAGAKSITVGANFRDMFFYVTAHRSPVRRKDFTRLALAPFVLISAGLWVAAWMVSGYLSWSLYLTLFAHATMCAGDFAMLSFYRQYEDREIITYDDVEEKAAYFFLEEEG
ncbi:MAG TPA: DUF3267 domain-containing protein [Bacteroidetes bacterium]|nr:DUF3267 domain-containing protein [Bacteroidota bacterium]